RPELIHRAFVDFISTRLHPFWSLNVPKLRLIARRILSDELIALQFEPNRAFKQQAFSSSHRSGHSSHEGWHGGQHINLSVLIDGVYHQRSYSLVGLPQQPLWWHEDSEQKPHKNKDNFNNNLNNSFDKKSPAQIGTSTVTIAIKPQGRVSDYLTNHAVLGTVFDSSLPSGEFTLAQARLGQQTSEKRSPISVQTSLLFIAGGSGITPMLGFVTQALKYGHKVTLLHYSRMSLGENLLRKQWQQLATIYPNFTYHLINTEDPSTYLAGSRHLNAASLLALIPSLKATLSTLSNVSLASTLADTQIFACGSPALLAGLYRACDDIHLPLGKQLRDNIMTESFSHTLLDIDETDGKAVTTEEKTVYLRGRQRQFNSSTTLLMGAENAGICLNHGCRQGICQLCRCNKISGRVKNIQTGKISNDGYESIQTCINVPMTDVVLDI
ncbi:flavin reductase family protein, partial [Psychrobacter sp. DAB_AL32B]|uniref:flavin reductase family protein n=1 Tax=Psychrobacter sp. DAB_AL32B TaxID=1028414 RepID=UPI000EF1385B